jgi:PAS domain-containing protein
MRSQDLGIGSLFQKVSEAVIVADASTGRIVLWNGAATEVFGYSHKEALGLSVEDLISGSEESGKPLSIHVERFNPALRLYARLGFRTVADKDVYLLMQRPPRAR